MAQTELLDEAVLAERLTSWLAGPAQLTDGAPVGVRRLAEGHSNLTYVVAIGERELILRRPPVGPLLPTAHDVVREFRVLELLARSAGPVRSPGVVAVCEDIGVLGAPFYLMERAAGIVIRDTLPGWLDAPAQHRLGLDLATALAEIHRVPAAPFVLAGLGREGGYLQRQLHRWIGQREGIEAAVAATGGRARALPDYDRVRDWLCAHLPAEQESSVVHGDYKLDNALVSGGADDVVVSGGADDALVSGGPSAGVRVEAVVDWEMATVGDPRADLGYLLSFWPEPDGSYPLGDLVTSGPGFPSRTELVGTWEQETGRVAGETTWFVTLALWKLAVLLEASYHRHLAGTTDDPFFATLKRGVPDLLAHAREVCRA